MGCASSNQEEAKESAKAATNGNAKGGGKQAGGAGGGGGGAGGDNGESLEPVVPKQNPYMSLTHKDIFHLKMSWKGIKRSMEDCGVAMFIKLFEANQDLKKYFEKFKDMKNEQLFKSQLLLNHATAVMEAIDITVTELDDAEKTHTKLKKMGLEHKARGVQESSLKEIRDPFLRAIEETLGDRYSDRMRNIYEVFIDYYIKAMIEGYNS